MSGTALAFRGAAIGSAPARQLFRDVCKNLSRVLTIYDLNITTQEARKIIKSRFRENQHIQDPRVVDVLVAKGYMLLEETLLQHAQRNHLMLILNPTEGKLHPGATRAAAVAKEDVDDMTKLLQ